MIWLTLLACAPESTGPVGIAAHIDPARAEHFLDVPFPSDDLPGASVLEGFPESEVPLAAGILGGWVRRVEQATTGFGNDTPAYFRFDGPLDLPASLPGTTDDPVLWIDLDDLALHPLDLRFVADPGGDPFYAPNTLAVAPTLGSPPRSGGRYAVVVTEAAGGHAPAGWSAPTAVTEALEALGVESPVASATVFTVQDATGELRALAADADARWSTPSLVWRRVTELRYEQGVTPSGKAATVATVTYADGGTSVAYQGPLVGSPPLVVPLDATWPLDVYEAELPVLNYQGLAERPYMSPGIAHISDAAVDTGWIQWPLADPEPEMMRITLSVPRGPAAGVLLHDHGTGGHAYNIVQRRTRADDGRAIAQILADEGWAAIGRDASLYGTRYPLIDEGYDTSLGFYNIVNAPAWRDNHRQTALDGYLLRRYVELGLDADLPDGVSIDTSRVRTSGHSLGAVTTHLGVAMAPGAYESAFVSGTGGLFLHYFFDTGLITGIDPELLAAVFPLFGAEVPDELDTASLLGAVLGLPEPTWDGIDRLHPAAMLFQWQMDPSDPMAVARDETLPIHVLIAPGDRQTPDFTAEALAQALPDATVSTCEAQGSYDPHYCFWREQEGFDAFRDWLAR
ncbi:MAG: hypothetical protein H6737_31845 [Alphaproteobacteria bacterium]|nr:hypothetical protein [Alphaproteobacteria bacterium]